MIRGIIILKGFSVKRLTRMVVLLAIVSTIVLAGCKTKKSIIKSPLKEEGPEYLLQKLKDSELKFAYFSAKFNTSYTVDKNDTDFKGQIRIKKDGVIWISFSPALGIEMARLMITVDSIKFINRLDKTYFVGDYEFVNKFLQTRIDFDMLQSFIIGNDFQFYETTTFRAAVDNREYKLSTTQRRKLKKKTEKIDEDKLVLIQSIWLNPENFKISRVNLKEYGKEHKRLEALYSNFVELEGQLFPAHMLFDVTADKNINININYNKLTINQALSFPFSIPRKYDRIE